MKVWMMEETFLGEYLTRRKTIDGSRIKADASILSLLGGPADILAYDDDGNAHIQVQGVLTPDGPDLIDIIMGEKGTSYKAIIKALEEAPEQLVKSGTIYLHAHSPGGTVTGAEAYASAVRTAAASNRVVVINEGLLASAALWGASGATWIVAAGRSSLTGSIGAVATVVDEKAGGGVQIYNFVNPESANKVPDPSTQEGAQVFIDCAQELYKVFLDDVLQGRSGRTTKEQVESLKGSMVTAEKAVKVGLIDKVAGSAVQKDNTPTAMAGNLDGATVPEEQRQEEDMELEEYLKEHPEARAKLDAQVSEARSEGEQAAQTRQADIVAKLKPIMDADYPQYIKNACADAIAGTRSAQAVEDLVFLFDQSKAQEKSEESNGEQEDIPDVNSSGPEAGTKADDAVARDAEWNKSINSALGNV